LDAYNKRHPDAADLHLDLVGLRSPERQRFFVGSGLDGGKKMSDESADKCRSLPYIGIIVAP
jgi:hypoxanthine-guanine phosphoribosyltransferase